MQDINNFRNQILLLMQLSRSMPDLPIVDIYNNRNILMTQVLNNISKSLNQSEMTKTLNQAVHFPVVQTSPSSFAKFDPLTKFEEEIPSFDRTRSAETCVTKSDPHENEPSSPYSLPSPIEEKKEVKEEYVGESAHTIFSPNKNATSESRYVKLEAEEPEQLEKDDFSAPVFDENHIEEAEKQQKSLLKKSKKIVKEKVHLKKLKPKRSEDDNEDQDKSAAAEPIEKIKKARAKKEFWQEEEDAQLMNLLEVYGPKWTKIGRQIGGKSGKQTRDRYMNTLRPGISHDDWTEEEDKLLASLLKVHGKRWCTIATFIPGRTENQVKNRYYCVTNKLTRKTPNPFADMETEVSINIKCELSNSEQEDLHVQHTIMADQSLFKSLPSGYQTELLQKIC